MCIFVWILTAVWGNSLQPHRALIGIHGVSEAKYFYLRGLGKRILTNIPGVSFFRAASFLDSLLECTVNVPVQAPGTAVWGTSLKQHKALIRIHGVGKAKLFYLRRVRVKGTHKLS